jgi:hypothetical protein
MLTGTEPVHSPYCSDRPLSDRHNNQKKQFFACPAVGFDLILYKDDALFRTCYSETSPALKTPANGRLSHGGSNCSHLKGHS